MAAAAAGGLLATWAFVCVIDPWGALPLSPPLPRVPVSSNARFAMPAVARGEFDAALIGTSTSRLVRPELLDGATGWRWANLSMNSATPWEQARMLGVFLAAHPDARAVAIGLDAAWCTERPERLTAREFPEWIFREERWRGYLAMLTPYAVQESFKSLAVMLRLKPQEYGSDGYTRFTPPEDRYDPARVAAAFARWSRADDTPAERDWSFPAMGLLEEALAALPAGTRGELWFPAIHASQQGAAGGATAGLWAACKARAGAIAARHGAVVVDLMRVTAMTVDRGNYWDPLHARQAVADWEAAAISAALAPGPGGSE